MHVGDRYAQIVDFPLQEVGILIQFFHVVLFLQEEQHRSIDSSREKKRVANLLTHPSLEFKFDFRETPSMKMIDVMQGTRRNQRRMSNIREKRTQFRTMHLVCRSSSSLMIN